MISEFKYENDKCNNYFSMAVHLPKPNFCKAILSMSTSYDVHPGDKE
jgi:hypothetical protein